MCPVTYSKRVIREIRDVNGRWVLALGALLLAVGIAAGGWFVGRGVIEARTGGRMTAFARSGRGRKVRAPRKHGAG